MIDVPDDAATPGPDDLPEAKRNSPENLHVGVMGGRGFDWAPDGNGFAAVVVAEPEGALGFAPDLVTFDLDGEMKTLGNFEGLLATPEFSPGRLDDRFHGLRERHPVVLRAADDPGRRRRVAGDGPERTMPPSAASSGCRMAARLSRPSKQGERRTIGVVDPEAKTVKPFFDGAGEAGHRQRQFSLSADGKHGCLRLGRRDTLR